MMGRILSQLKTHPGGMQRLVLTRSRAAGCGAVPTLGRSERTAVGAGACLWACVSLPHGSPRGCASPAPAAPAASSSFPSQPARWLGSGRTGHGATSRPAPVIAPPTQGDARRPAAHDTQCCVHGLGSTAFPEPRACSSLLVSRRMRRPQPLPALPAGISCSCLPGHGECWVHGHGLEVQLTRPLGWR